MPKYVITSIPLVAALVVGFIAYGISMGVSGAPSEAEIRRAPRWEPRSGQRKKPRSKRRESSGPRPDFSKIRKLASGDLDDLDVTDAEAEPKRTTRPKRRTTTRKTRSVRKLVEVYCKQTLRSKRQKAQKSAKNVGMAFGGIALAMGYLGVFYYFKNLPKGSATPAWQQVLDAQKQAGERQQPPAPVRDWDDTPTETDYEQSVALDQYLEDEELPPDTGEFS